MQTDEGGITRQGGECAAGIFPLGGFFNSPEERGFAERGAQSRLMKEGLLRLPGRE